MKNLLEELRKLGLSEEKARLSIKTVFEWVDVHYPVMASLARTTVLKESDEAQKVDPPAKVMEG